MLRIAVCGFLLAFPAAAQIRTRILDPSGQSSIVAGHIANDGDLIIGGYSTNGELPIANAFQHGYASSGLMRTRDGGRTWSPAQRPVRTNFRLLADPVYPDTVYALDVSGLYRSTDAGDTWRKLTTERPVDLQVDPHTPSTYYLLSPTQLLISSDSGETWTSRSLPPVPAPNGLLPFSQLSLDPFTCGMLYIGGYGGLYRTTPSAENWTTVPFSPAAITYSTLHFDPAKPGLVYLAGQAATIGLAVYRSNDSMSTWTRLTGPVSSNVVLDPLHSGTLYSKSNSDLAMSTDFGDTWKTLPVSSLGTQIYLIPGTPSTVLLFMATSYDGGQTWGSRLSFTLAAAAGSTPSPGTGYALVSAERDGFIARLDERGEEVRFCTLLGGMSDDAIHAIATDEEGNIYAGGYSTSLNFPTTPGAALREYTHPAYNGFVAKFEAAGTLLWSTRTPGAVVSIAIDADGTVFLFASAIWRLAPDGSSFEIFGRAALAEPDISSFSGPYLTKMVRTSEGEFIVAGELTRPSGNTRGRMVVTRIGADGELISKLRMEDRGGVQALSVDSDGNAVITGYTNMPFLIRVSREGEVVSRTSFANAGDRPYSLHMASNGDAIISGALRDTGYFLLSISQDGNIRDSRTIPQWTWIAMPTDGEAIFSSPGALVFFPLP